MTVTSFSISWYITIILSYCCVTIASGAANTKEDTDVWTMSVPYSNTWAVVFKERPANPEAVDDIAKRFGLQNMGQVCCMFCVCVGN